MFIYKQSILSIMTEVGLYKIEIFVGANTVTLIQRGYRDFTDKIEKYQWHRVRDIDENLWSLNTNNIQSIRITPYDEPHSALSEQETISVSETPSVKFDKEFY